MQDEPELKLVVQVPPLRENSEALVPLRPNASVDSVALPVLDTVKLWVLLVAPCNTVPKAPVPVPPMVPKVPCCGVPDTPTDVVVPD